MQVSEPVKMLNIFNNHGMVDLLFAKLKYRAVSIHLACQFPIIQYVVGVCHLVQSKVTNIICTHFDG